MDGKIFNLNEKLSRVPWCNKALNGLTPDYLVQMFIERSRITYHTLRYTSHILALPQTISDVLSDIALDLKVKELTGEPINEGLASIVLCLLKEKLPVEKAQKKLVQYPRPQNVEDLKIPRVNPLIWSQLTAQNRTHDSKAHKKHKVPLWGQLLP